MIHATYYLIRYIPDLAKGEYRNVGVLLHYAGQTLLTFDDRSFRNVMRDDPNLDPMALAYMSADFIGDLERADIRDLQDVEQFIASEFRGTFVVSSPGSVAVDLPQVPTHMISAETIREELEVSADRLKNRLTRPAERRKPSQRSTAKSDLGRLLVREFSRDEVFKDHPINQTGSGLRREVDFFVNHQTDVAVEVIQLKSGSTESGAIDVADQVYSKADDILKGGLVRHVVAYLPVDDRKALHERVDTFELILSRTSPQSPAPKITLTTDRFTTLESVRELADRSAAD